MTLYKLIVSKHFLITTNKKAPLILRVQQGLKVRELSLT